MNDAGRGESGLLERKFGLARNGTDVRTEVVAGITTFLTMAYIVFVNPAILANAGMDKGAVFVATCLAAAISTLIMALYANYPIALAPGMGLNAFFAFTLVLTYKYTWQQALGFVFVSGVLALIISITPIREYVINSIPKNLKLAISAGIGLFLAIIALEEAKIVVAHPATLVTLGDLKNPTAILMLLGFMLIAAGADVIALGEMGIGNTASSSLLLHRLGPAPLDQSIGIGAGQDADGMAKKKAAIEKAAMRSPATAPLEVLTEFGGLEIAMMAGAVLGAAFRALQERTGSANASGAATVRVANGACEVIDHVR